MSRLSALTSSEQQRLAQLEAAKQAVQTLRADKIVLEDRLAQAAAELAAKMEAAKSRAEDVRTLQADLRQRDLRFDKYLYSF